MAAARRERGGGWRRAGLGLAVGLAVGAGLVLFAQARLAPLVVTWVNEVLGDQAPAGGPSHPTGPTPAQVLTHHLTPLPARDRASERPQEASGPAAAWPLGERCPRDTLFPREFNRCLFDAVRLSDTVLNAALDTAIEVIEARVDLMPTQRARWKGQLQETHSRFLLFRNMDCQSVAPFEGGRAIGNFEQRSLCLIVTNERRAQDLRLRYGEVPPIPTAPVAVAPVVNVGLRPATWLQGTAPPVD
ncbi:DUF1311 domain-containing protein [Aquabacter sp. L1I39]|uniref:lysozyme inhibitor LprI family protein n=1 Tax=Aquabacter sp. L1I39 TaxID=2820278 RepID=UPI001ADA8E96|nr:lysozyme inhibitor LprI family protein [Aquabacter sp. L1I39]QTL02760.1 DUF1311 domain-containing protein [Aquabacter sp. L1I39]